MRHWTVRLTAAAESDFKRIIEWTIDHFGEPQARAYAQTLSMALEALTEGPSAIGAKRREEILKGLLSLHVARQGRKGSHFVLFRVSPDGDAIDVLRLLHDATDLPRHLGREDDG